MSGETALSREEAAVAAFGLTIGIRTHDPRVLERLPDFLPYGWRSVPYVAPDRVYEVSLEPEGNEATYALRGDGIDEAFVGPLDVVLDGLERDLRLYLVDHAPGWVFVHAGAVGWNGRAIVVPGRSGAGKSTLTLELVRAGAVYYSDEYAVFDSSGRVHPFATTLQFRPNSRARQHRRTVEEVGAQVGTEPLPVGLVVAVAFKEGAPDRLQELTPGRGALSLLEHAPIGPRPDKTLEILEKAVSDARIIAGERGEATSFASRLLGLLDTETPIQ